LVAGAAGDMGREKLTEWRAAAASSSATWARWADGRGWARAGVLLAPRSRLRPRPPVRSVGDAPRWAGSRLDARRRTAAESWPWLWWWWVGGTGGTGGGGPAAAGAPQAGDAARNERSVILPVLDWRRRLLPADEAEPRRAMRFVTVAPTGVGGAGWLRRAAAAAAAESSVCDSRCWTKALAAASDAEALGGARCVCMAREVSTAKVDEGGLM